MTIITEHKLGLAEAIHALRLRLRAGIANVAPCEPRLMRIVQPLVAIDLFDWLGVQKIFPKVFWSSPDDRGRSVGVGEAISSQVTDRDSVSDWQQMTALLAGSEQSQAFIGGSFTSKQPDQEWQGFGLRRMVIPRFEIIEKDEAFFFVCSLVADQSGVFPVHAVLRDLDRLLPECASLSVDLLVESRQDVPHYEDWEQMVGKALDAIAIGTLDKAVLARRTTLAFADPVDPVAILRRLSASGVWGYGFLYQLSFDKAFLGWTPELLFSLADGQVSADAVAGTRPRGKDLSADKTLHAELVSSAKDLHEHDLVVAQIKTELEKICVSVKEDTQASILKLKHQQHRKKIVRGILKQGVTAVDVCLALHPTPAVGGVPRLQALDLIENVESFQRGWYAGPFGVLSDKGAQIAVAIRSALITGKVMHLYAGAGTVAGSSARLEWEEIEAKIKNYLDIVHA